MCKYYKRSVNKWKLSFCSYQKRMIQIVYVLYICLYNTHIKIPKPSYIQSGFSIASARNELAHRRSLEGLGMRRLSPQP